MRLRNEHLPLFNAFSDICQKAYGSWHLATSPALAKVGLADLFRVYAKGNSPPQVSKLALFKRLFRYYAGGWVRLFLLICCKAVHILSARRTIIQPNRTVFIDTYFIIKEFLKGNDPLVHSFPGIKKPIADAGWGHVLLPRFYGTGSPFVFHRIFRALQTYETPVLTEFELLRWREYVYLFVHMLIYPWLVVNLLKFVPKTREGMFVRFALLNGLNSENLEGAVHYFMGRRLAPLLPPQTRCLQWYENQQFERCFNRGLREAGGRMPIYGVQLFIWPPELINMHVDNHEAPEYKPDCILANGLYFLQENIDIPCKVGPSLRYSRLFETQTVTNVNGNILVLLPYYPVIARAIVECVIQVESPDKLLFKFHPTSTLNHIKNLIPEESGIVHGDIYDLVQDVMLIIGSSTSALVEMVCVGIPVIVLKRKDEVNYTYLPDVGKGLVWEEVYSPKEIEKAKKKLMHAVTCKRNERLASIQKIRNLVFTNPKDISISQALDL